MFKVLIVVAVGLGLGIAALDSRPGWDDTGITAGLLFATAGALGYAQPKHPWLWALAVGVWIPLYGLLVTHNPGSLLALVVAFAGAYAGMGLRQALRPTHP